MTNTICAIGIYYGKFKNYFDLWLKTCSFNPRIDFIIITDILYTKEMPSNVKLIRMTLEEIRNRAELVTGLNVCMPRPYKTCDLRPLYGEMFKDLLSQYEYWGEFDFDMLYGDIYSFMQKYNYSQYDKFLPLGHLSFYKNCEQVNSLYKKEGCRRGPLKKILTNPEPFAFDEIDGINSIILYNNRTLFYKRVFADITPLHKRFTLSTLSSINGEKSVNYKYQTFYWKKGKVFRAYLKGSKIYEEEFVYIHLRERPNFPINQQILTAPEFYITPDGFIPKFGDVTIEILKTQNIGSSILVEYIEKLLDRCKAYKKALYKKLKWHVA